VDAIEAIETCRAMRWFTDEPVDDDLIRTILHAANCAPSPGNTQGWEFIVVKDREVKRRLGESFLPVLRARWTDDDLRDGSPNAPMYRGVIHLAEHFEDVPVLVVVAGIPTYPEPQHDPTRLLMGSLFGVTQNLLIAARSLGLGGTLTMFHEIAREVVTSCLAMPANVEIAAVVPLGWPALGFGPVRRRPVEEITHWDVW
jgi:nitroreductase